MEGERCRERGLGNGDMKRVKEIQIMMDGGMEEDVEEVEEGEEGEEGEVGLEGPKEGGRCAH